MNKGLWYQCMSASDAVGLFSVTQVRDFLEMRHPIAGKKHRADVVADDDVPDIETPNGQRLI